MNSLLELLVVLPLLLSIVTLDSISIGTATGLRDGLDNAIGEYAGILNSVEYAIDGATGNRYPQGGGNSCGLASP